MSTEERRRGPKIRIWTKRTPTADQSAARADFEVQQRAFEDRIAELETAHANMDRLFQFQKQAYQDRITELKQTHAETVAEKKLLKAELSRIRGRHRHLLTRARSIANSLKNKEN